MQYFLSYILSPGFSVAVIDEDGTQQLHITEVKPDGLAAAKGKRNVLSQPKARDCAATVHSQC